MKLIIFFKNERAHDSLIVFSELTTNYISNNCHAYIHVNDMLHIRVYEFLQLFVKFRFVFLTTSCSVNQKHELCILYSVIHYTRLKWSYPLY